MRFRTASALAALALLLAFDSSADFHEGSDCTSGPTTDRVDPGEVASWCPSDDTEQIFYSVSITDCNWTDSGGVTLGVDQCSGDTSATCTTPMWDYETNAAWVVTSGDKTGRFSVASGFHEITASAISASGVLVCTGRQ